METAPWQTRPCGQPSKEREAEERKQTNGNRIKKAEESKGEDRRRVAAEGKQDKACPAKAYLRALIINAGLFNTPDLFKQTAFTQDIAVPTVMHSGTKTPATHRLKAQSDSCQGAKKSNGADELIG